MYQKRLVDLTEEQGKKIIKAVESDSNVNISLKPNALSGNDPLWLTKTDITKLERAKKDNKGVMLKLSKTNVQYIKQKLKSAKSGGVLGTLGTIALTALPSLLSFGLNNSKGDGLVYDKQYKAPKTGDGLLLPGTQYGDGLVLPGSGNKKNDYMKLSDFLSEMNMEAVVIPKKKQ